jgi:hypothetical protein
MSEKNKFICIKYIGKMFTVALFIIPVKQHPSKLVLILIGRINCGITT